MRKIDFLEEVTSGVGIYKDALVTYSDTTYRGRTSLSQGLNVSLMTAYDAPMFAETSESWARWGAYDNYPAMVLALLERNPIAEPIMHKIVDFVAGKDLVLYRKKIGVYSSF